MGQQEGISRTGSLKASWVMVNIFYWLSWFALGVVTILLIAASFGFKVKYIQLPLEITAIETSDGQTLIESASRMDIPIVGFTTPMIPSEHLPGIQYALVIPMILAAGMVWIAHLLKRFLRTVREGKPFAPENPKTLKDIGILIAIGGPFYGISNYIYASIYKHFLDIPNAIMQPVKDMQMVAVFAGLIIIVIAQVYDQAVKMKHDADLTI